MVCIACLRVTKSPSNVTSVCIFRFPTDSSESTLVISEIYRYNGKKMFATYCPVEGHENWRLIMTAPNSEFVSVVTISLAVSTLIAIILLFVMICNYLFIFMKNNGSFCINNIGITCFPKTDFTNFITLILVSGGFMYFSNLNTLHDMAKVALKSTSSAVERTLHTLEVNAMNVAALETIRDVNASKEQKLEAMEGVRVQNNYLII